MEKRTGPIDEAGAGGFRPMAWPVLFAFADGAVTLGAQSSEYWAGGYQAVEELNPVGAWLLGVHPAAFAGGLVIWIGVVTAMLFLLPRRIGRVAACAVMFGHGIGICSWLIQLPYGVLWVIPVLLLVRLLTDEVWYGGTVVNPVARK